MSSIDDELAAIEASARGGRPKISPSSSRGGRAADDPRVAPSQSGASGSRGRPSSAEDDDDGTGLLVGFPRRDGHDRELETAPHHTHVDEKSGMSMRGSHEMAMPPAGSAGAPPPNANGRLISSTPVSASSGSSSSSKPRSCDKASSGVSGSGSSSKPVSHNPGGGGRGASSTSKPSSQTKGTLGSGSSRTASAKPKPKTKYMDFDLPEIPPYKPSPLPEIPPFKPAKPPASSRMSESERLRQRQKQMVKEVATKSGTKDHRPLVGGFAAAAYEAARADHFQPKKPGSKKSDRPRDIPSI